jgi:hypothetical protein
MEPEKQGENWLKLTHNSDQCPEFVNTVIAEEKLRTAGAKSGDCEVKQHKRMVPQEETTLFEYVKVMMYCIHNLYY